MKAHYLFLLYGSLAWLATTVSTASLQAQTQTWEAEYARLLKTYVKEKGVRYAAWNANAKDKAAMAKIVQTIGDTKPPEERKAKLAFYINAYNAWILYGVLDKYPIKSVRDIAPFFGFFTGKRIVMEGEKISLNHLEKQILLKQFKEPRVHFAINCASASCPPLADIPYTAENLDALLEKMATRFLNENREAIRMAQKNDRTIASISSIFDWYESDFEKTGGVLAFINHYRKPPLPENTKIKHLDYDWNLNETR